MSGAAECLDDDLDEGQSKVLSVVPITGMGNPRGMWVWVAWVWVWVRLK